MSKKFPLELHKFKKLSSNKETTTLQHPDGHSITVVHKALSPKMRSELMALKPEKPKMTPMWKAGEVKPSPSPSPSDVDTQNAKDFEKGFNDPNAPAREAIGKVKDALGFDDGGSILPNNVKQKLANGGPPAPLNIEPASDEEVGNQTPLDITKASDEEVGNQQPLDISPASNREISSDDATTPMSLNNAAPQDVSNQDLNNAAALPSEQQQPDFLQGYNQQMQGMQQQASAESEAAQKQTAILDAAQKIQKTQLKNYQDSKDDLDDERQAAEQDIKDNLIDPEHYWHDHSKIMSMIGLLIGGFNPTNSPNGAAQMIQNGMERDLQAQVQNLGARRGLLEALNHKFNNLNQATDMARVMQADRVSTMLRAEAARSNDPVIKARALMAAGQLQQNAAPAFQRVALINTAMKAEQGGENNLDQSLAALRIVNPDMAKEIEGRYIPGIGVAKVPIDQKARDEIVARESLQQQVSALREWSKKHSGELKTLSPSDVNYGQALSNSVQDAYRRANGQGVFREAEANFVKGIVDDDPTAFYNKFRVDPKYKALEDSNEMALNGIKKGYGLPQSSREQRLPPQQQRFVEWAKQNPKDPRAQILLKKLGF